MIEKIIGWLSGDKAAHFLMCYFIVSLFKRIGLVWWGVGIAVVLSIGKELWDWSRGGQVSWGDLVADAGGIVAGMA